MVFLLVAATWALAALGQIPLSLGIIPIFCAAGILAMMLRNTLPLIVLLLSPMTVAFAFGVGQWFSARPSLVGHGLPAAWASNLDQRSRVWLGIGGCKVNGSEWVYDDPYNSGLRLTVALLGPPKAAYRGVYPTIDEVKRFTEGTQMTPAEKFFDGIVLVDGKEMRIGERYAESIRRDLGQDDWDREGVFATGKVVSVNVNSECLIVRMKSEGERFLHENVKDGAMLIDLKTMRPFARYSFVGTLPRIPQYALHYSDQYRAGF